MVSEPRVVSLLGSASEIVCALGAGHLLVGRSHECDNPAWIRSLPQLTEPAFDISMSSREIDAEVRRRLRAGEPLYRIDTKAIRALNPDIVLAQSHCEVCAVTPQDVERSEACLPGARVVPLTASSLTDIFDSMIQVATELHLSDRGKALVASEQERLRQLEAATANRIAPTVAVLEWTDPIFPMGNWGPELVRAAGGALVLGNEGQHSFAVGSELLPEADPEYLVIAPCGFSLERSLRELPVLQRHPWWNDLRAVRNRKVAFADGNLFFNRSGTTVVRTAEIVAEILHGVVAGEQTEGRHWLWSQDAAAVLAPTAA
jgi:iron complex transport system substrate-binding protein